jgi:molybdopterin adenylyltransferase
LSSSPAREFIAVKLAVLTVSDTRTLDDDRSGQTAIDLFREAGHEVVDVTPEALEPLITKRIPGFGELFRWISFEEIGTSTIQSRAEAALCGATYVFLLPGSTGGVRTAVTRILLPQLDHRTSPCNFVMMLPRIRTEREDG